MKNYEGQPLNLPGALDLSSRDEESPDELCAALPDDAELVSSLEAALCGENPRRSAMHAEIRRRAHRDDARDHLMRWVDKVFGPAFRDQHDCIDFDHEVTPALRPVGAHLARA